MQIVLETVDLEGRCRTMVVEAMECDGSELTARRAVETVKVLLSIIADWSAVEHRSTPVPLLERWIARRLEVVCF